MSEEISLQIPHDDCQVIRLSDDPIYNPDRKMDFNRIADKIKELKYEDFDNQDFLIDEKDDKFVVITDGFKKRLMKIYEAIKYNIPVCIDGQAGTAKTKSVQALSVKMKKNLISFNFNSKTTMEDLMGKIVYDLGLNEGFSFRDGPFIDAFANGKWLLIDDINYAPPDILHCIETALDSHLVIFNNGYKTIEYNQHPDFRLFVTQNTDDIKYISKQKTLTTKISPIFKHIEFAEIPKDELIEIATKLCKYYNYTNTELIQDLVDFHYEWSHRPDIISSSYRFTLRDISDTIKLIQQNNNPLDTINTIYASRFPIETRKALFDLIESKYNHLKSDPVEFALPKQFPPCFKNQSLLNTVKNVDIAFKGQRNVLLVGKEGSGLTQVARWIANYYLKLDSEDKSKKHEYCLLCTPKTTISDLIGQMIITHRADEKIGISIWKNGPLIKAIKKGSHFVLDSLDLAPFEVSQRLKELLESEMSFYTPENPKESQISINPKFRLIATANEQNLSTLSPSLLSKFIVIYLDDQLIDLQNDKKADLVRFLLEQELNSIMRLNIKKEFIDELANSVNIESSNLAQISLLCRATGRIWSYCGSVKPSMILSFVKNLIDSNCQEFEVPEELCSSLLKDFASDQSKALKEFWAKIIACSVAGIHVCLVGPAELEKARMAVTFSDDTSKAQGRDSDSYQLLSFNKELLTNDVFGTFWTNNFTIKLSKGSLYNAIEKGLVFVADTINLAEDDVIQSLAVALEQSSGSKIALPGLGKSVLFHKKFQFIACQDSGENKLPQNIAKKLRTFEYPTPTLDDWKANCKTIAKSVLENAGVVSESELEKLASFIDKINGSNIQHITKWSKSNVRTLLRRISDSKTNPKKYLGFTFVHHLLFYVLSGIEDSVSKTIFEDIMKILVECFEIADADKSSLEKCYFEDPVIENSNEVNYLKKGEIGVQIPQHIMDNKIVNNINFHSLWNTLFKVLIINDKEPLLISGNSSYKTFLASLILPNAQIVSLYQGSLVNPLLGSTVLLNNRRSKEFYLEQFCRILQIKDRYNELLSSLNEKRSISTFGLYMRPILDEKNNQKKIPDHLFNILNRLINRIEDPIQDVQDFTTVFKPGVITTAVLEQYPLILEDFSNLTPSIFKMFNNSRLTLKREISNLYAPSKLLRITDKFRIISTSDTVDNHSNITMIACSEYSDNERNDAIDSLSSSINIAPEQANFVKSFSEKYFSKFEKNVPFSYIEKILQMIQLFENYSISIEEKLVIAVFRTLCENSKEASEKIKIIRILDEVFEKNVAQTFVSLIDNTYEEKTPLSQQVINEENNLISDVSKLSIACRPTKDVETGLYFSRPFIDMIDVIHTALAIHYPVILEGPTGIGKHVAINHVADMLRYKIVKIGITSATTVDDFFGKIKKSINKDNETEFVFVPSQILQIINSNSDNKAMINSDKTVIVLEGINNASPSLLDWISPLFDVSRKTLFLPNGETITKSIFNIIALNETTNNSLPNSFHVNCIYHSIPQYTCDQINKIALKIFRDEENLTEDHKTFMNYFNILSQKYPELYSLNDIRTYQKLTSAEKNAALSKLNTAFFQELVLLNKCSDKEGILNESKSLGINIAGDVNPSFCIKNGVFCANVGSDNEVSLPIDGSHIYKAEEIYNKLNYLLTPDQRNCMLFLMCSVLSRQAAVISGPNESGKTFMISNFAKLMGKELLTIRANNHTDISTFMDSFKPIIHSDRDKSRYLNVLCRDSNLKEEIKQILDEDDPKTWTPEKIKIIRDKAIALNNKEFTRAINELDPNTLYLKQERNDFANAMNRGKWILIDNIEFAPKEFIEKIVTLCSNAQSLNLYECGPDCVYSRSGEDRFKIHEDFRLFINYNPNNVDPSRRISPSILNKFVTFVSQPIDSTPISSGTIIHGISNGNIEGDLWKSICARLASVHEFYKQSSAIDFTAHSLLYNINIISNYIRDNSPEGIAKMLCKCLYMNYCSTSKDPAEYYKQLQNELLKSPDNAIMQSLDNFDDSLNKQYMHILSDLYELQTNKSKSMFTLREFIKKVYQYKFKDIYNLYFHVNDTVNQLDTVEAIHKYGDLSILTPILHQLFSVAGSSSISKYYQKDLISNNYFMENRTTKHSLSQLGLLQHLFENGKLIEYTPSCLFSADSRKALASIGELLANVTFDNILAVIKIILQNQALCSEANILLNCEAIKNSSFSNVLLLLPMMIKLHQNGIPFTVNKQNLSSNNDKGDYLVEISVKQTNFELDSKESKILCKSNQVNINESEFYSAVYHLIDSIENKTPVDFEKNVKHIDYPQINNNNHPLYNLYPNDNQSCTMKLFKSAILFGSSVDDKLSSLFGQFETNLLNLFNSIWKAFEYDKNNYTISMIDSYLNIESSKIMEILYNILMSARKKELPKKKITVDVDIYDRIEDIKAKIQDKQGIPADEMRLYYNGQQLEDRKSLSDYSITRESKVDLILRMGGGLKITIEIDDDDGDSAGKFIRALNNWRNYFCQQYRRNIKDDADGGDVEAMDTYSWMLEYGEDVDKNVAEAYKYQKMAADAGSVRAMNNCYWRQRYGKRLDSKKKDVDRYGEIIARRDDSIERFKDLRIYGDERYSNPSEEAALYIKMAADQGDGYAMYKYAQMLDKGEGVKMNKEEAIRYYRMAADNGDRNAMFKYAEMLDKGEGVPMNIVEAFKYYRMAADKGDNEAMKICAWKLENGEGCSIDKGAAIAYYKTAADHGDNEAMFTYGIKLEYGDGVPENKDEALRYYVMSKNAGNKNAYRLLNNPIWKEFFGKNVSDSIGSAPGSNNEEENRRRRHYIRFDDNVYDNYEFPSDVEPPGLSDEELLYHYKYLADKGDGYAMYKYNWLLETQKCPNKFKDDPYDYYKVFALAGDKRASYKFGRMLERGEGVEPNINDAIRFYKDAADKGDRNAMYKFAQMLEKGNDADKHKEEISKYYKMAADKGDRNAMYKYGQMAEKGEGYEVGKKIVEEPELLHMYHEYDRYCIDSDDDGDKNRELTEEEIDYRNKEEALKYYINAADEGDEVSMAKSASMLEEKAVSPGLSAEWDGIFNRITKAHNKTVEEISHIPARLNEFNQNIIDLTDRVKQTRSKLITVTPSDDEKELAKQFDKIEEGLAEGTQHKSDMNGLDQHFQQMEHYYADATNRREYLKKKMESEKIRRREEEKKMYRDILVYYKLADDEGNEFAHEKIVNNFDHLWGKRKFRKDFPTGNIRSAIDDDARSYVKRKAKGTEDKGAMVEYGKAIEGKNLGEASDYYQKAGTRGDLNGMTNSYRVLSGNGDSNSKKIALGYLKRAADEGDHESMYNYALRLEKGDGVPMNKELASQYFKKAGHFGIPAGLVKYGLNIRDGINGAGMDKREAFHHFKVAADHDDADGMYYAGMMLYYGDGVGTDYHEAGKYFDKAAQKEQIDAMYQYGIYVDDHNPSYYNYKKAAQYAKKAADRGHPKAFLNYKKYSYYYGFTDLDRTFQEKMNEFENFDLSDIEGYKRFYKNCHDLLDNCYKDYYFLKDNNMNVNDKEYHPDILRDKYKKLFEQMEIRNNFMKKHEDQVNEYKRECEELLRFLNRKKGEYNPNGSHSSIESIDDAIQTKVLKLLELNSKFNRLAEAMVLVPNKYRPENIIAQYNEFSHELKTVKYERYCEENFLRFLENKKRQFENNKNNRSALISIFEEVQQKMTELPNISTRYNKLGEHKSAVKDRYLPDIITTEFMTFANLLENQVATNDSEDFGKSNNFDPDMIKKLIEAFKTLLNKDQTKALVGYFNNPRPVPNASNYPQAMIIVPQNYWNGSTVFQCPIYSDEHPPIKCNNEDEMHNLLNCIYFIPYPYSKVLGGERFIEKYSNLLKNLLNEPSLSIRSPNALGVQRNQDPNSLFVLVFNDKLDINGMSVTRNDDHKKKLFNIQIENKTNDSLSFNLRKDTVIDVPTSKQPIYISETWSGTIEPHGKRSANLKWCCMDKNAGVPYEDFRITPFVFICPNYNLSDWPFSDTWWFQVQPNLSNKVSKSNNLWNNAVKERPAIQKIPLKRDGDKIIWENLPTKAGGAISNRLYALVNDYFSYDVKRIDGVVRPLHMANKDNAQKVMIITNQFALAVDLYYDIILIVKTESGIWDGYKLKKKGCSNNYSPSKDDDGDFRWYVDYDNIPQENIVFGQFLNGMRSDPKCYNAATYNSQDSRAFLLGTLGISIPIVHSGQIIIPSLHGLIDF